MSQKTSISWTDWTWNPVRGCTRISPGCGGPVGVGGCYAETLAARFSAPGLWGHGFAEMTERGPRWTGKVAPLPEKLADPLSWREPRRVFVNSTSDLFHKDVPFEFIAAVFGVMAKCPQHEFQILTKRADRMLEWHAWASTKLDSCLAEAERQICGAGGIRRLDSHHPYVSGKGTVLPNVVLGVSCEDRKYGVPRLDILRKVPAARRMVSFEPLLEDLGPLDLTGIHWAIAGAESGRGNRPMDDAWVRSIRDQCAAQGVAFHFKQRATAAGRKLHLPILDGVVHDAFCPEVPRG